VRCIGECKKYIKYIYSFTLLHAHGWRSIVETEEKEQKREKANGKNERRRRKK